MSLDADRRLLLDAAAIMERLAGELPSRTNHETTQVWQLMAAVYTVEEPPLALQVLQQIGQVDTMIAHAAVLLSSAAEQTRGLADRLGA